MQKLAAFILRVALLKAQTSVIISKMLRSERVKEHKDAKKKEKRAVSGRLAQVCPVRIAEDEAGSAYGFLLRAFRWCA